MAGAKLRFLPRVDLDFSVGCIVHIAALRDRVTARCPAFLYPYCAHRGGIIQPHFAIFRDSLVSVARRVLSSSVDDVSLHCLSVVPRAIQLCCLFLAMNWHAGDWLNKRVESMIYGSSAVTSQ